MVMEILTVLITSLKNNHKLKKQVKMLTFEYLLHPPCLKELNKMNKYKIWWQKTAAQVMLGEGMTAGEPEGRKESLTRVS